MRVALAMAVVVSVALSSAHAAIAPFTITFTAEPPKEAASKTAVFEFTTNLPASFTCYLDGKENPTPCLPPVTYAGLSNGSHSFSVIATATNPNGTTRKTKAARQWTIDAPPETTITEGPTPAETSTTATFSFTSDDAGATFECALDSETFTTCTSPTTYASLAIGDHTFRVEAVSGDRTDPTPASATWTVRTTAPPPQPPNTQITGRPATSTDATMATFSYTSDQVAATFQCALDGPTFATCVSPTTYDDLLTGGHIFRVSAVNGDQTDPSPAIATWTIQTAPEPRPAWITWLGVAMGGVAALAVGTLTLRWRHLRLTRTREGWQLQASDDEPPKTCRAPGTYTWRRSCTATPSAWRVEGLALSDPSTDDGSREIAPAPVEWLNQALTARRARRTDREVQDLLARVSEDVAREIESWLRDDLSARTVELGASLSGCRFECDFTHYQCVSHGIESHWEKQDEWKGEIASTSAPLVAVLQWPVATEDARRESISRLERDLFGFVTNADIPWKRRR